MRKKIIDLLTLIWLVLKGIPVNTAFFFHAWEGANYNSLKNKFQIINGQIINEKGESIPISYEHFFNKNLNLLSECFKNYQPKARDGKLEMIATKYGHDIKVILVDYASVTVFLDIFKEEVYGITPPDDSVIIDVGMNIGMASLYFASMPAVKKVLGFELVPSTFELAKTNLNNNPFLEQKADLSLIGWAATSGIIHLDNLEPFSVFSSIANKEININPDSDSNSIPLKVTAADLILKEIISKYSNSPIIIKLDCEGSEYEIIELLDKSHLLSRIKGFLIEWHEKGPEEIITTLKKNGFGVFYINNAYYPNSLGMIYAWN